jgi:hypothetical protein
MTMIDQAGVLGVGLILFAYGGSAFGKLNPQAWPSLTCNLIGALLILWSLVYSFNLSAALMEGAWAVIAAIGLIRLALRALQRRRDKPSASTDPVA